MSINETKPTIPRPIAGQPGVYDVPSDTTPGATYRVDANGAGFCSCKGFEHRGRCKHLDRMVEIESRRYATTGQRDERQRRTLPPTVTAEHCRDCGSNVVQFGTDYCAFCAPGVYGGVA